MERGGDGRRDVKRGGERWREVESRREVERGRERWREVEKDGEM